MTHAHKIVLYTAFLLVAGRQTASTTKGDLQRVRLAVVNAPSVSHLPVILSNELGHFRQEGLEVEITDVTSSVRVLDALLSGSSDVGTTFPDILLGVVAGEKMS